MSTVIYKIGHNPQRQPRPFMNGFLTAAERELLLTGNRTQSTPRASSSSSHSLPHRRTPPRPHILRNPTPRPRYQSPNQLNLRNRLVIVSPREFIFQAFHTIPHIFVGSLANPRILMTVERERQEHLPEWESQYRVKIMITLPQLNAPTPNLSTSIFQNDGVMLMTSALTGEYLGPDPLIITQMKILVWNCRGARRQGVVDAARALFQRFNPDLVILMETRTSVDGAVETIDQLMFHDQIIISAEGYAGGMWLLWNSNQITLSQQRMSNRMVHAMISFNHAAQPFMLSAVYNYPQPHLQNQVWDELLQFSSNVTANWLVVGDFNCILNLNEKKGGGKIRLKKILGFRDCIAKCGLIDLGYAGHPFTWNNRRYGKA